MSLNTPARSLVSSVPLKNASIYYTSPEFIADQVFPIVDMDSPVGKITTYLPGDFFRNEADLRGESGRARRAGFKTTTTSYSTKEIALAHEITDEYVRASKKQNALPLQPYVEGVEFLKRLIMLKREADVAAKITGATWADGVAGGEDVEGLWASGATGNTFKADIKKGLQKLREKGIAPGNPMYEVRLLLDDLTFDEVVEIAAIKDQIKYTSAENVTPELLAKILKVDKVIVPNVIQNTAKEKKAGTEFTSAKIWQVNATKGMALLYTYPKQVKLRMMTSGLIVRDRFDSIEGGGHERLMNWREDAEHQTVYELAENRDQIQVAADSADAFKDTILT